ncbi:APC family permease [Thermoanaerobacterium sp. RBIITD]|uniref:APC family permease n=1 Tax=Thermoanaerobacterium sp. RBIITD TaxID=1550240 RepID=UPI000BB84471|nr:APC family permease [Thermoanaerobacterium sp. RBIITD]
MSIKESTFNTLKEDALNFLEVVALSVAIIAPTFAMSMNVGLMAQQVSFSVSTVFFISAILVGFVTLSFIKFNQYFSSAGSVYTFIKKSWGKNAASVSGWILSLAYLCFACGCSCAFGSLCSNFIQHFRCKSSMADFCNSM